MDIVISSGHGLKVRGAKGVLDEVDEARRVTDRVAELLRSAGVGVHVFHDNTSNNVSANLNAIVNAHNSRKRDRDVSVHFNAFQTTDKAMGTECLYTTQQALAAKVSTAMANGGGLINRGAKKRTNLAFLNRTAKPAVLLEVCFVDSSHDAAQYRKNFEAICRGIAETIGDVKLTDEPTPVEPPIAPPVAPPPPVVDPEFPTGAHVVDIVITVQGSPRVTINGDLINDGDAANRLDLTLAHAGDIEVTIDGEDFQVAPPITERPTLREGSRGHDVQIVQRVLGVTADGIFGPNTKRAVESFQRTHNLNVDGVVGAWTWQALEKVFDLGANQSNQMFENIVATVFGGSKDPNNSAYSPFDKITDTELSVSLPWKFQGTRPQVLVRNRANGKEIVTNIRDVGPWLIDDDYWVSGARPLAETHWKNKTPLPRGPHKGKVPNGAGIDVTPGTAKALGIDGRAMVDWMFV